MISPIITRVKMITMIQVIQQKHAAFFFWNRFVCNILFDLI